MSEPASTRPLQGSSRSRRPVSPSTHSQEARCAPTARGATASSPRRAASRPRERRRRLRSPGRSPWRSCSSTSRTATSQPWTPAAVRGVVFDNTNSVDEYLRDASYGQLAITGDVHGWYTIDATNAGCAYTTWANQARSKATAAGVNLSAYQYIVYAFPQASSCGWAGLAYLPGTSSWINGAMTLRVVSHEVSHNLGVHHASTLACSTGTLHRLVHSERVRRSVHGHGRRPDPTPRELASRAARLADRRPDGDGERHVSRLTPAELSGTPRLVRVARERRHVPQPRVPAALGASSTTSPAGDPVVNGVSVRIAPADDEHRPVEARGCEPEHDDLLGCRARRRQDDRRSADRRLDHDRLGRAGGRLGLDPDAGWRGHAGADRVPRRCRRHRPAPRSVQLSWPAATDNVGVDRLPRLSRRHADRPDDGAVVPRHGARAADDVRLSGACLRRSREPRGARVCECDDTGSGRHAAPSVPTGLNATVQKGRKVALSWNASSDNVGVVGYDVYRNGTRVAQPSGTSYTDRPGAAPSRTWFALVTRPAT